MAGTEPPKSGLKKIISALQAKLQEMKVKFSEIRARYIDHTRYLSSYAERLYFPFQSYIIHTD
jgi:hypothetical protein